MIKTYEDKTYEGKLYSENKLSSEYVNNSNSTQRERNKEISQNVMKFHRNPDIGNKIWYSILHLNYLNYSTLLEYERPSSLMHY